MAKVTLSEMSVAEDEDEDDWSESMLCYRCRDRQTKFTYRYHTHNQGFSTLGFYCWLFILSSPLRSALSEEPVFSYSSSM